MSAVGIEFNQFISSMKIFQQNICQQQHGAFTSKWPQEWVELHNGNAFGICAFEVNFRFWKLFKIMSNAYAICISDMGWLKHISEISPSPFCPDFNGPHDWSSVETFTKWKVMKLKKNCERKQGKNEELGNYS